MDESLLFPFWLMWHICQGAYATMNCPSCVVVIRVVIIVWIIETSFEPEFVCFEFYQSVHGTGKIEKTGNLRNLIKTQGIWTRQEK